MCFRRARAGDRKQSRFVCYTPHERGNRALIIAAKIHVNFRKGSVHDIRVWERFPHLPASLIIQLYITMYTMEDKMNYDMMFYSSLRP